MKKYMFIQQDGFYALELKDDQAAKWTAEINPATVRVETVGGQVIWADNNRWN